MKEESMRIDRLFGSAFCFQKDHDKELIKRALAKQATKDAAEFQKVLSKKDEEIEHLHARIKQLNQVT